MDRLTPIFERFAPQVQLQFADHLCGQLRFGHHDRLGHIHCLDSGEVVVQHAGSADLRVTQPSVIFVPGSTLHQLDSDRGATLLCAQFEFGQRHGNPLTLLEPEIIVVPMAEVAELSAVYSLLMNEAFSDRCGKSLGANQLLQYLLLILLRHLIKTNTLPAGPLRALGDEKILRAVTSIHRDPGQPWTLEGLAQVALMSRATFARRFRVLMGKTALDYLTDWRITVAKALIEQGLPIKSVATEVGYSSAAALTRVFTQRAGLGPRHWALQNGGLDSGSQQAEVGATIPTIASNTASSAKRGQTKDPGSLSIE